MATLLTQIQIKRDEYDNLKGHVLKAGEPAIAIVKNVTAGEEPIGHMQFAVGDGITAFEHLSLKLKDGVTNVSGQGTNNQIAVFTDAGNITPRNVYLNENNILSAVKQIQITNDANVPPLTIDNAALVTNLDADLLDGHHGNYYFNENWINSNLLNPSEGIFPLLINTQNENKPELYVNVSQAISNASITFKKGSDIKINGSDDDASFTLNQANNADFTFSVIKSPGGDREKDAIVSAINQGTIQSNAYELSYTPSGNSGAIAAATMAYDAGIEAIRFIFA